MSYARSRLGQFPNMDPYGYPGSTGTPVYGSGPTVDPISGVSQVGGDVVATGTAGGTPVSYGTAPAPLSAGLFGVPWWLVALAVVGYLASRRSRGGRDW